MAVARPPCRSVKLVHIPKNTKTLADGVATLNPSHLRSHVSYFYVVVFWFVVNIDNSIQIDYMRLRLNDHVMNSVRRFFGYVYMGDDSSVFLICKY